ncbi:hypothetical protein DES53_11584 [Roseimicrobium gellanilyticum]|uniref:Uncharacterized protein n=1 Tax=Roseimicrobium gellanilyticum TaxID=748857 RepID=A0A366H4K7_9BACT|nr:hypothetical protein [Roseimicrobium gellanilyticum]RBP36943.1 hypothetical protein DES53_11584 [Roseimicrobium gellanilyticum]
MSRRTKLLILGVFLVLLSIPVIHLARTWEVEYPLRFRLVEERARPPGDLEREFIVEVRNRSATRVVLSTAGLNWLNTGAHVDGATYASFPFLRDRVIPPHYTPAKPAAFTSIPSRGKVYYTAIVRGGERDILERSPLNIYYFYQTAFQHRLKQLGDRLSPYSPVFIRGRVTLPTWRHGDAPLENVGILRSASTPPRGIHP